MIFGVLQTESTVQVNDKTRLSGIGSYLTPDEADITKIEIEAEASAGFIEVGKDEDDILNLEYAFLDYQYNTDGDKVVTLRITTDGVPSDFTKTVKCITEADDKLFSKDEDILPHEPELYQLLRKGRSTFLDVHRKAQERILDSLDDRRYFAEGERLTKENIHNKEEVKKWSSYLALQIIFEGVQVEVDDVFSNKSMKYRELALRAADRAYISIDGDKDGQMDSDQDYKADLKSGRLVRR